MTEPFQSEFESLTRAGRLAVESGRLEEGLALYERALAWAREDGDPGLVDRAYCNHATLAIELAPSEAPLLELRRILLRNLSPENSFRAAYAIARACELKRDRVKAGFYARIAREQAQAADRDEWLAWAHNLTGNLLISESLFEEAAGEYETALRFAPSASGVWRALIEENLGYCHVVRGKLKTGMPLLYRSLRALRRLGASRYEIYPRLSLCFAHLEAGRAKTADAHGRAALAGAETAGDREAMKMALYLLGDAAKLGGDLGLARAYFGQLQVRYYPETPQLPDLLLAVDVRQMINLKA